MKRLLHIDNSPREPSWSRQLTAHFARLWQRVHTDGDIVYRDLGLKPVPNVSQDWIAAVFSAPADHTPPQRAAIAVSDALVTELLAADEIVIGAPMHNFSVSTSLKAWIDQVVRIGRTVELPSYVGLVTGKRTTIITTRGGRGMNPGEPMAHMDAQVPYLKQILGFIGITDVSVVYAGNLAGPEAARQKSLSAAFVAIDDMFGH